MKYREGQIRIVFSEHMQRYYLYKITNVKLRGIVVDYLDLSSKGVFLHYGHPILAYSKIYKGSVALYGEVYS